MSEKKSPPFEIMSLSDLAKRKYTLAQMKPQLEGAFRRGYWWGYYDAVNQMRSGVTLRQAGHWHWFTIGAWRYGDCSTTIEPPQPEPWKKIRKRILKRDGGICQYCGVGGATHVDHVVPVSRDGSYDDGNLVVACRNCNLSKGTHLIDEWPEFDRKRESKRWREKRRAERG